MWWKGNDEINRERDTWKGEITVIEMQKTGEFHRLLDEEKRRKPSCLQAGKLATVVAPPRRKTPMRGSMPSSGRRGADFESGS